MPGDLPIAPGRIRVSEPLNAIFRLMEWMAPRKWHSVYLPETSQEPVRGFVNINELAIHSPRISEPAYQKFVNLLSPVRSLLRKVMKTGDLFSMPSFAPEEPTGAQPLFGLKQTNRPLDGGPGVSILGRLSSVSPATSTSGRIVPSCVLLEVEPDMPCSVSRCTPLVSPSSSNAKHSACLYYDLIHMPKWCQIYNKPCSVALQTGRPSTSREPLSVCVRAMAGVVATALSTFRQVNRMAGLRRDGGSHE